MARHGKKTGVSTRKAFMLMFLGILAFSSVAVRADETVDMDQNQGFGGSDEQLNVEMNEIDEEARRQQEEADKQAA